MKHTTLEKALDSFAEWLYAQATKTRVDIITLLTVWAIAWLAVIVVVVQVRKLFF